MRFAEYRYVQYHSTEWALLVELGWVTMTVDAHGVARMLREYGR